MKKSFLNSGEPFITVMVQEKTAQKAELKIRNAISDGATAIGLQCACLQKEDRSKEKLTALISSAENKPVYLTNYRGFFNEGASDEGLAQGLFFGK